MNVPGSHYSPGNTSTRTTAHQVTIKWTRRDRTISRGIRRSAQPRINRTSSEDARIALFPAEYFDPHNGASSEHQVDAPGSHSSPGNTSIRTTGHRMPVKCTHPECTLPLEILRSAQFGIKCTSSQHARIALFPWKYVDPHNCASSEHRVNTPGSRPFSKIVQKALVPHHSGRTFRLLFPVPQCN